MKFPKNKTHIIKDEVPYSRIAAIGHDFSQYSELRFSSSAFARNKSK